MVTHSAASTPAPTNESSLIHIRGLTKDFPVEWDIFGRATKWLSAVHEVDLELVEGETLGLIGESGSGKSTLGRLLLRLIPASSGTVHFEDLDVLNASRQEMRRFRQQAQIIFQDPFGSLDPRMKVSAIIAEGMDHLRQGRAQKQERVRELLELVGLPISYADRYPHEFSGGQRQRISIARALAVNPKFLVADEPVSALDVSIQGQILNLMRDLQERLGLTYLFIGHDMSVIRHVADRVAVMYLGEIVEVAPAAELFQNPLHPYTQALLSSVPSLLQTRKMTRRIRLEGEIPTAIDPPRACRFAGRCFRAIDRCRQESPSLESPTKVPNGDKNHQLACFNYEPVQFEANSES